MYFFNTPNQLMILNDSFLVLTTKSEIDSRQLDKKNNNN